MKVFRFPVLFSVLLLASCDLGIDTSALPPLQPDPQYTQPIVSSQETSPAVSGASQIPASDDYVLAGYRHASDARTGSESDGKPAIGLEQDRDFGGGAKLVNDTVTTAQLGGTTTIVVRGGADKAIGNIKADGNRQLALNRAEDTARKLRAELREELREKGLCANGRALNGEPCLEGNNITVGVQEHPQMEANCKPPSKGGCDAKVGRKTTAGATFSPGPEEEVEWVCRNGQRVLINKKEKLPTDQAESACVTGSTTTTTTPTTTSIPTTTVPIVCCTDVVEDPDRGGSPDPSKGVFGNFSSGSSSSGSSSSGSSSSGSSSSGSSSSGSPSGTDAGRDDSSAYFDFYPEDLAEFEDLSVMFFVDVPSTFRVGGSLREADVELDRVVLYCGDGPCSSPAFRLDVSSGSLTVGSSAGSYRICPSPTSSSCSYYYASGSTQGFSSSGSSVSGGDLRVGFRSPTPASVRVLPTLELDRVIVSAFVPVRSDDPSCEVELPPRSCWTWEEAGSIDMRDASAVITTRGQVFERVGDEFRLPRPVYGTVGSN